MAEKLLLLEQVNLFVGDQDPEDSNHIKLQSLGLPTLEQVTVAHLGGGAPGEVEFGMNAIKALQPTFKFAGFAKSSYRAMGVGTNQPMNFTGYGVLKNKQTGDAFQAKTVIRGIVSRIAPDAFDRSSAFGHDHQIGEVTHYELSVDNEEWFYWDYFTTRRRQFGVDELTKARVLLGIE
ncbi:Phage major tail tube protein [Mesorhizobium plurifarium]|uniref:Phage major tail tube protein n=1 Tax=Mesorhizobium plurifarium TaxID=69974 RepID=A0A090GAG7_MESPL|nr:Phage major tail tube protein [Mesorhizobium plurifarium]